MIESRNATWIRDWAIEWSTNHGELWISRIRRSANGWTRTVTFDAQSTGADVERVATLVERMPAVEATIEIPRGDAASVGIRVTHSEAQEPPIAEINALVVQLPRRPMRIEIVRASNDKDAPEAPAPNELSQAIAALGHARARCEELRDALASAQATLDEALRVQGAIWDAVGGQRDGESLVDAVRRAVGTRSARSFPKPERAEARQWWAFEEPAIGPVRLVATGEKITMGELETGEPVRLRTADLLADPRWRYLGNGERPIDPGAPAPTDPHPLADAIAGLSLDEIAALSAAGWVMRWTAPSMRWVTPGGAALDPATWRETLRREAARLTGKRYVVWVDGVVMEEAKMTSKEHCLSDSMDAMRQLASVATAADSEMLTSERGRHAESVDEGKAEIDRLRSVILGIGGALDHRSPEHIIDTAKRVVAERDTAYQRGQQEMRGRAAVRCARLAMKDAHWPSRRALEGASAAIHGIPIAKTPTVSASEVTGEAIPGGRAAETAGAGESVARGVDLATIWKNRAGGWRTKAQRETDTNKRGYHDGCADTYATCSGELGFVCDKLREELAGARAEVERQRGIVEAYAAKVESYAAEIVSVSVSDRLAKVRYERGRSDDALKAIEDALLDAGAPRHGDEPLVDAVRRALDNREARAAKVERKVRVGDVVMYHGTKRSPPAIVLNLHADGAVDLREMDDLGYREGVPMGFAPGTWRFRD